MKKVVFEHTMSLINSFIMLFFSVTIVCYYTVIFWIKTKLMKSWLLIEKLRFIHIVPLSTFFNFKSIFQEGTYTVEVIYG